MITANRISNFHSLKPKLVKNPEKLGFGCRIMAFTTSKGSVDNGLTTELLSGENPFSLKNLSAPYTPGRDGINAPYTREDITGYYNTGNPHGWGIVVYPEKKGLQSQPEYQKSMKAANQDPNFDNAVQELLSKNPDIALAHVRHDETIFLQKNVSDQNAHPFVHNQWSFVHNGVFDRKIITDTLGKDKQTIQKSFPGKPEGTTDSEYFFYHFLSSLKERYETTEPGMLTTRKTKKVFANCINDIIKNHQNTATKFENEKLGIKGELQESPALNFILSDGENLYAFRNKLTLYLGVNKMKNGNKEYIISSEHTQPEIGEIKWIEIPENHILTIRKNKATGIREPFLTPLSKALRDN